MQLDTVLRHFLHHESRVSLIESLVALSILGIIAVTFLTGVTVSSRAAFIADEQATAESLARSQMEWVQSASYTSGTGQYSPAPIPTGKDYMNFAATIAAQPLHTPDDGIQKITVIVSRSGLQVFTLESYKVDR